jgi:hypothetical protein
MRQVKIWPVRLVKRSWPFRAKREDCVDEECDKAELLDLMLDRDGIQTRGDAEEDYESDMSL